MTRKQLTSALSILVFCSLSWTIAHTKFEKTTKHTYVTTSTKGDFALWQVTGGTVSVTWSVTDSTGQVAKTLSPTATCTSNHGQYAIQTCTVQQTGCAAGTQACQPGDAPVLGSTFSAYEVPGVAFYTVGLVGAGSTMVHAGYELATSCPVGATSDYVSVPVGLGQPGLLSVIRTTPNLSQIIQASFGMQSAACASSNTPTGQCSATPSLFYNSQGNGQVPVSSAVCSNGVTTVTTQNGMVLRVAQTSNGILVVDYPSGLGGSIAIPKSLAVTSTDDIQSRNFSGIVVPSTGGMQPISFTTQTASSGVVPASYTNLCSGSTVPAPFTTTLSLRPAGNTSTIANPNFPDFTTTPSNNYSNSLLQPTYSNVASIPGLWILDGSGTVDNSRAILTAYRVNNQTLLMGTIYDWQSNPPNNSGYVINGSIMLFENANTPSGSCSNYNPCIGGTLSGTVTPNNTVITPYVWPTEIAAINEAYATTTASPTPPWGSPHNGIDFNTVSDQQPFQAVTSGTVYLCPATQNNKTGNWQVAMQLVSGGTSFLYNMEMFTQDYNDVTTQLSSSYMKISSGHVNPGDLLFYLHKGASGTGAHVHFGVNVGATNLDVCPQPYFTTSAYNDIMAILNSNGRQGWNMCYQ